MVKILRFHCRGHGFNSLAEELNSHMSYSAAKKKKKSQFPLVPQFAICKMGQPYATGPSEARLPGNPTIP